MKKFKVKDLKLRLQNIPDDMDVVVGWQFENVLQADVKTIRINGTPITAFQLISDPDLVD